MKLLFLYVENMRKFRNQIFNFDSNERFRFDNKELSYIKNDILPQNFFTVQDSYRQSNTTVSAIVGENGCGKTSLSVILDEIFSDPTRVPYGYVCVYSLGDKYYCLENIDGFMFSKELLGWIREERLQHLKTDKQSEVNKKVVLPRLVYLSPMFSLQGILFGRADEHNKPSTTTDLSTTYMVTIGESEPYYTREMQKILRTVQRFGEALGKSEDKIIPLPCPNDVTIACASDFPMRVTRSLLSNFSFEKFSQDRDWYADSVRSFDYAHVPDLVLRLISILHDEQVTAYARNRVDRGDFESNNRWIMFGLAVCRSIDDEWYVRAPDELDEDSLMRREQIVKKWRQKNPSVQNEIRIKSIKLLADMFGYDKRYNKCAEVLYKLNDLLVHDRYRDFSMASIEDNEWAGDVLSVEFSISKKDEAKLVYDILSLFVKGNEAVSVSFGKMSSGEMSFLSIFGRLLHMDENEDEYASDDYTEPFNKNVIVMLDEAETTLHPDWQRKLVYCMLWFFENFMNEYAAHLIFASHSPLVLSDIPQGNVCFLGDVDKTKVTQTFGANIFDLYRLPFVLTNGTTGTFAQNKIDALIEKIFLRVSKEGLDNGGLEINEQDKAVAKLVGDERVKRYLQGWIDTFSEK